MPRQPPLRKVAGQNVGCRHEPRRVVRGVVYPDAAITVGRHFDATNNDAGDAGRIRFDRECVLAGGDPQQFDRQARMQLPLNNRGKRNPAHDAVEFVAYREQAAARRGILQNGDVAQQACEPVEVPRRIATDGGHWCLRCLTAGFAGGLGRQADLT